MAHDLVHGRRNCRRPRQVGALVVRVGQQPADLGDEERIAGCPVVDQLAHLAGQRPPCDLLELCGHVRPRQASQDHLLGGSGTE